MVMEYIGPVLCDFFTVITGLLFLSHWRREKLCALVFALCLLLVLSCLRVYELLYFVMEGNLLRLICSIIGFVIGVSAKFN